MIRVYIYCEGQTEETFINEVLYPYFYRINIIVTPIICTTKRTATKKFTGGVSRFDKLKKELNRICSNHQHEYVTTMFDYYALPEDTPGRGTPIGNDIYERVAYVESQILSEIASENFIPNLLLHEFEGLLFSDPTAFRTYYSSDTGISEIIDARNSASTPEHINDGVATAPSKRIENAFGNYDKVLAGSIIALEIGIDKIMQECVHFRQWIHKISTLASE